MKSDGELLREFALNHDQHCFTEIVQRHIKFVYAVSMRRLQSSHAAQDATQAVFVALARKARSVAGAPSVVGWLHRSAYLQTQYLMRSEKNRIARENEAHLLGTAQIETGAEVSRISAVLDEVLCELPEKDRAAIMQRYFLGQDYATLGAAIGLTENAARMRVERALQRIRSLLQRRGIASSAAVLASVLPTYASVPEPSGLTAIIAKASVSAAATTTGATLLTFMTTTKIIVVLAVMASVGGFFWEMTQRELIENKLISAQAELSATDQRLQNVETKLQSIQEKESRSLRLTAAAAAANPPKAAPVAVPGITPDAPKGWKKNGSANEFYEVGVDSNNSWGGMPSAYVKSVGDAGKNFGGMMQTISADSFRGQRVQLNGWMKTQDAAEGGHLWMRVDGQGNSLQFDNMDGRAPKGTTDWQSYSVVLDVPPESSTLNYGFFVGGQGQVWVNGVTITKVDSNVPTTNMHSPQALPSNPVNLGFAPTTGPK